MDQQIQEKTQGQHMRAESKTEVESRETNSRQWIPIWTWTFTKVSEFKNVLQLSILCRGNRGFIVVIKIPKIFVFERPLVTEVNQIVEP